MLMNLENFQELEDSDCLTTYYNGGNVEEIHLKQKLWIFLYRVETSIHVVAK
jgi:hypothetical protein